MTRTRRLIPLAIVAALLVPAAATAKINPTVSARACLTKAIARSGNAAVCFTPDGWKRFGAGFVKQQARKGWTVTAGDEGSCCSAKVLWAEVILKQGERVVDRVYLIYAKVGGKLKIAALTETHPKPPTR